MWLTVLLALIAWPLLAFPLAVAIGRSLAGSAPDGRRRDRGLEVDPTLLRG
jgi:hypothetical protein